MKKLLKNLLFVFATVLFISNGAIHQARASTIESINPPIVDVVVHNETYSYNGYDSIPYDISIGAGATVLLGNIWLMVDYTWTETWVVDSYGNKLEVYSSTAPVITSGDYYISSLGDINVTSETLASNGSSYAVRISVKYTEPKTNITYSKYSTYTIYNTQLSTNHPL